MKRRGSHGWGPRASGAIYHAAWTWLRMRGLREADLSTLNRREARSLLRAVRAAWPFGRQRGHALAAGTRAVRAAAAGAE